MRTVGAEAMITVAALLLTAAPVTGAVVCNQVASPNIGVSDNVLASVAANSPNDIWAVGSRAPDSNRNRTVTLVQHFDGRTWKVAPSPNIGSSANALLGVAAQSGQAWAVGYYFEDLGTPRSLIEAWDGSRWGIIDHPRPGVTDRLFAVSAASPNDVWAVGESTDSNGVFQTLIEHFDGAAWSIVASPNPGSSGNHLYGVVAISSSSVWAVGQQFGSQEPDRALIEHWDGTGWSVVQPPADGTRSTLLYGVSGVADDNIRSAGEAQTNLSPPVTRVLNGTNGTFSIEPSLSIGSGDNHLYGVFSSAADAAWAVGTYVDQASGNLFTLLEGRASSGWSQIPTPSPGAANGDSQLGGVTAVGGSVWAVGTFDGPKAAQTLILRCQ